MVAKGVPMRVVMDILGHAKIATTTDLYAHVMPAAHRDVANTIDQVMRLKQLRTGNAQGWFWGQNDERRGRTPPIPPTVFLLLRRFS
jgi:hypothetical protein